MKDMAVSREPPSKKQDPKKDLDTLSDMEDESEEDASEGDGDEDGAEGLGTRYKQALADSGGPSSNDDHSFTRYLRTSQMDM